MRPTLPRAVLSALAAIGLLLVTAAGASAAPAGAAPSAGAAVSGVNDWRCAPSERHPEPVVLVHALFVNGPLNFATLAPTLAARGYCVFYPTYGTGAFGPTVGGLTAMEGSAATIGAFVDRVLDATGAGKVDLVGHSEGTTVSAYYMKFLGGDEKVEHYAGFAANYRGTTLNGLGTLARTLRLDPTLDLLGCTACRQLIAGSEFTDELERGGVSVPGPTYTNIVSRYDRVVTPYTNGTMAPAGNVHNVVIQDRCRADLVGHVGQAVDPNVAGYVLAALDPEHAGPVACVPFVEPGV